MDKQARKRTEEAEAYQRKAQEELESKEKQILSECLEQAEAEVGELVRSEEQAAEKSSKRRRLPTPPPFAGWKRYIKKRAHSGCGSSYAVRWRHNTKRTVRMAGCILLAGEAQRCLTNPADAWRSASLAARAIMKRTDYARRKGEPILCSQRYPPMRFWQNRAPCMAGG